MHPQLYGWNDWNNWTFQVRRVNDFIYPDEDGNPYTDPRAPLTFYGGIGDNTWCDNCSTGPVPYDFASLGYYYKKTLNKEYKETENGLQSSNNVTLMRYADVLLMRAECKIKGSTPDVTAALGFINQVRSRVGAFTYNNSYSPDQAFELLKRERQIELIGEQSRFTRYKTVGNFERNNGSRTIGYWSDRRFQDKYYLFPIPQTELDTTLGFGDISNGWN